MNVEVAAPVHAAISAAVVLTAAERTPERWAFRGMVRTPTRKDCLTSEGAPLWRYAIRASSDLTQSPLSGGGPKWTMDTPLRRDHECWQALVEIDALAALMLGLPAEQLCAMYRTHFAVLRKYEYKMVFDAEGRKICGYHQSAGYRQSLLQDQAKAGDLPKEWKNIWKLNEQNEADPTSVDWQGHFTPPFTKANRESSMKGAALALGVDPTSDLYPPSSLDIHLKGRCLLNE